MGFRQMMFPIALAIVWVVMAAMAMVDFASFTATTQPHRPAVARVAPAQHPALPQGRIGARLALAN
ncbi:MAG TPA: hypothetical protein VI356_15680 [Myxococcales bacterium]